VAFVMDTSVTMAWCFDDETNAYTESVLDRLESDEAFVPVIWVFEVVNVLLTAERKGRLAPALADEFMMTLGALPITVKPFDWPAGAELLLLRGRATGLTGYDTAYLDLALRSGCPLATQDRRLREVARDLGVELLMFHQNS
jgi:predicted nucleic acid-binding protein